MTEPLWLDLREVCVIQSEILAESGGYPGILNKGMLDSTLNKPKHRYHYGEDVTLYELAASYGYGFVKNHCFIDGNKRIALISVYTFLYINGIELTASEVDAASFFLELAASMETQEIGMEKLVRWIQHSSETITQEE